MTEAEYKLWHALRRDQFYRLHFRHQHPLGPYTLDFYYPSLRLCVEVDGGQHAEARLECDKRRELWLAEKDIVVVRYWNNDVLGNVQGVLADLARRVERRARSLTPSLTLPLSGGGKAEAAPRGKTKEAT